jgi:hypothetical protein
MFIDSLLIEYQANLSVHFELERNAMTCTPFRQDYLYSMFTKIYELNVQLFI